MRERHVYLFYQDWRSDKVYFIHLERGKGRYGDRWQVRVEWGKRGGRLNSRISTGPGPWLYAHLDFEKLEQQKERKGYRPGRKPCEACGRNCPCEP